jgi:hypothetical protein
MIQLPIEYIEPSRTEPQIMVIYGEEKTFKTGLMASVPHNLILDTQGGTEFYKRLSVPMKNLDDAREILQSLAAYKKENGKNLYKYITIDTATDLVDIAKVKALQLYQQTPLAMRKDGTLYSGDILDLSRGAGYGFLRRAFVLLYESFLPYCDTLVLICHAKERSKFANDETNDETVLTVDLPGQMARTTLQWADAIGYMYRDENKSIISFRSGGSTAKGSRVDYLREKEIVVAESDENTNITAYPERLFPSCK